MWRYNASERRPCSLVSHWWCDLFHLGTTASKWRPSKIEILQGHAWSNPLPIPLNINLTYLSRFHTVFNSWCMHAWLGAQNIKTWYVKCQFLSKRFKPLLKEGHAMLSNGYDDGNYIFELLEVATFVRCLRYCKDMQNHVQVWAVMRTKLSVSSSVATRCKDRFRGWMLPIWSSITCTRGNSCSVLTSCSSLSRSYPASLKISR